MSILTKDSVIKISRKIAWVPLSVLIGHSVFAKFFGHEPYVDPVMHFSGGTAAAYFFRAAAKIADEALGELTDFSRDLISFGLTCSIALFWEIGEFCSDTFLGTNVQKSNTNTMRDLILGMVGALVFLLSRYFLYREKRSGGQQK